MPEEIVHTPEGENTEKTQQVIKDNVEEGKAEKFQEKTERTLAYFNDMDNPEFDDIEKDILSTGLSIPEFKKQWVESIDAVSGPQEESIAGALPDENYTNMYDFKNSVWDDFATHFQSGLNRVGYGLGVVVPGIAAAVPGEESEFVTDWIDGMGEWYDKTEERTSIDSNKSFFETGNIRAFAGGMGSGLASMAPMVLSFIPFVGKALYTATTFSDVFGSVLKNGEENGLTVEQASQMALGLSIPITMLEKVGMEGVTSGLKKGAVNKLKKGGLNTAIKKASETGAGKISKEEFLDFVKVGMKDIGKKAYAKKKVGNIALAFGKGAGTEGVTETLQSILEQSGEQIWDTYWADQGATVGKGKYGTDIKSRDFWLQAAEEGFYGAILGGVMSGGGSARHGLREQSAYHYVRTSLDKGKPQNIKALKNYASKQQADGSLTKQELDNFVAKVDQMVEYEGQMWHKMDNPAAKYQTYNQMLTRDNAKNTLESPWLAEQEQNYPEKQKQITELLTEIQKDSESIVQAVSNVAEQTIALKKEEDSGISKKISKAFFTPKETYNYNPVDQDAIAPNLRNNINAVNELLPKELQIDPINNEQANNEGKIQAIKDGKSIVPEKPFGNVYKTADDVVLTASSLSPEGKSDVIKAYNEAIKSDNTPEQKQAIIESVEAKYGINKDGMSHIAMNPEVTEEGLTEIKSEEDTVEETTPKTTEGVEEKSIEELKEEGVKGEDLGKSITEKLAEGLPKKETTPKTPEVKEEEKPTVLSRVKEKAKKAIEEEFGYQDKEGIEAEVRKEMAEEKAISDIEQKRKEELASIEQKDSPMGDVFVSSSFKGKSTLEEITKDINQKYDTELADLKEKAPSPKEQEVTEKDEAQKTEGAVITEIDGTWDVVDWSLDDPIISERIATKKEAQRIADEHNKSKKEAISQKEQELTPEEQAKIDEDVARNTEAEQKKLNKLASFLKPKEQRATITAKEESLIRNNPELYNEIKKYFKRIFPFIPVREVNRLGEKYGAKVLARIVETGIEIDPSVAIQSSLVHEYGHVFLEILGENHPLVKLGYKFIKDTQFFKDAQELYPEKTEAEQLNEALTQAIAVDSLEVLDTKLNGSQLAKFKEWLKAVWSKLKSLVGRAKSEDVTRLLARQMTLAKKPFKVDRGSLVGFDMDQRKGVNKNPKMTAAVDIVSDNLMQQLLSVVSDKDRTFSSKKSDASLAAYYTLVDRYIKEKANPQSFAENIFEGVDLGLEAKSMEEVAYNDFFKFGEDLKEVYPELHETIDRTINSMFNANLELDKEEEIKEDQNQDEAQQGESSNNKIKPTKKVSVSVRSILSSIVDNDGYKIGSDAIFSYVSNVAERTYRKEGFVKALEADKLNDPIAKRILNTIKVLTPEQKAGFLREISSLIQVKSEGLNVRAILDEDGNIEKYEITNPIVNKDKTYQGFEERLQNLTDEQKSWLDIKNIVNYDIVKFYTDGKITPKLDEFLEKFGDILNVTLTPTDLKNIINQFPSTPKYTNIQNFFYAIGGEFDSMKSVANKKINDKSGVPYNVKGISGFLDNIFNGLGITMLNNSYLNGANNTVTTTQLGHWIGTLRSMMMNKESKRIEKMDKSPIYKDNAVYKYFKENGVNYSVFDSIRNLITGENIEYSDMTGRDYRTLQLLKYGKSSANNYYSQTLGVKSNRTSVTLFEVPSYINEVINQSTGGKKLGFDKTKLKQDYENQAAMLEGQLKPMLAKLKTKEAKDKLINDFNDIYIHTADANGNVTSGLNPTKYKNEIQEIITDAKNSGVDRLLSGGKFGPGKPFDTFESMVNGFFFVEALNRNSLNDIFGGSALEYAFIVANNENKGGVQQTVKRASSADSNGVQIEIDKPIHYVVFNDKSINSDSFKFNGSHLTNHISKETGSLDPLGINSKELAYQVDPTNAKTVYIKSSGLNLVVNEDGTTNLDGFGENVKDIAAAMLAVEKALATKEDPNPYVVFMDSKASKGTYDFKTSNFQEILAGDMKSLNNVNTIKIDNLTTPFNLNKSLSSVEEQEAVMSTQAAIIQFNAGQDINAFESAAVEYLRDKMQDEFRNKSIIELLSDFNYNIKELTKDMNEREKSATTEILEAIKEHNATSDNKINSFDHPSLKAVYEQFISSRLSNKGIKVEMAGNFMHQLPDMGGKGRKLKDKEVAVSWKMFGNTKEEAERLLNEGGPLEVVAVRIPASAELSMEASTVAYFLDTDANTVVMSDDFVRRSDSDHDGDKVMIYRKAIKDGEFDNESPKTKLFNALHDNTTTDQFIENQDGTLDLDPIQEATKKYDADFKIATLNDVVNVAEKMGLGTVATGRFSIAGKMMSLLSQSESRLNKGIKYGDKTLINFTNDSINDLAVFLQAALDIGNDPILVKTGFTESTINVGNAMLSLGLDTQEVIDFLKIPAIDNLTKEFLSRNLSTSSNKEMSFDNFFKEIMTDKKGYVKKQADLIGLELNGVKVTEKDAGVLIKFREFKVVADGLSKMIGYIQLDKSLPNNADLNSQLLKNIKGFKSLPFNISGLTSRQLKQFQVNIARNQKNIYEEQLLTANPQVVDVIDYLSDMMPNPFGFKKRTSETIMKIFAQKQIKTKRDDVGKWFYDFAGQMKAMKDFNKTGKADIKVSDNPGINSLVKNIQNKLESEENILKPKDEVIFNELEKTQKGLGVSSLERYKTLLDKYDGMLSEVNDAAKFEGNKFLEYIQFTEDADGRILMSLNPKFKATTQITDSVKQGFKDLQDIDPQLANDIIDYQLYRYGTNNKIGSMIDVLPQSINVNQLVDVSQFKDNINALPKEQSKELIEENILENLLVENKDELKEVKADDVFESQDGSFRPRTNRLQNKEGKQITYVVYDDAIHVWNNNAGIYVKMYADSDNNFTAFFQPEQDFVQQPIQEETGEQEIPNQVLFPDGTILTLPNQETLIDLGAKGSFIMMPNGDIVNNRTGNIVLLNTPIYNEAIAKYQEDQANNEQNNCN